MKVSEINNTVHVVYGHCMGVAIHKREANDNHLMMTFLVEDDGNWFVRRDGPSSAYWLSDMQQVLADAASWLDNNANKVRYGYECRE